LLLLRFGRVRGVARLIVRLFALLLLLQVGLFVLAAFPLIFLEVFLEVLALPRSRERALAAARLLLVFLLLPPYFPQL